MHGLTFLNNTVKINCLHYARNSYKADNKIISNVVYTAVDLQTLPCTLYRFTCNT